MYCEPRCLQGSPYFPIDATPIAQMKSARAMQQHKIQLFPALSAVGSFAIRFSQAEHMPFRCHYIHTIPFCFPTCLDGAWQKCSHSVCACIHLIRRVIFHNDQFKGRCHQTKGNGCAMYCGQAMTSNLAPCLSIDNISVHKNTQSTTNNVTAKFDPKGPPITIVCSTDEPDRLRKLV